MLGIQWVLNSGKPLIALASLACCLLLRLAGFLSITDYYLEHWLEMERV